MRGHSSTASRVSIASTMRSLVRRRSNIGEQGHDKTRRRYAMRALVGSLFGALVSASTASAQPIGGAGDYLKQQNIVLPAPSTPAANHVPAVRVCYLRFPYRSRPQ